MARTTRTATKKSTRVSKKAEAPKKRGRPSAAETSRRSKKVATQAKRGRPVTRVSKKAEAPKKRGRPVGSGKKAAAPRRTRKSEVVDLYRVTATATTFLTQRVHLHAVNDDNIVFSAKKPNSSKVMRHILHTQNVVAVEGSVGGLANLTLRMPVVLCKYDAAAVDVVDGIYVITTTSDEEVRIYPQEGVNVEVVAFEADSNLELEEEEGDEGEDDLDGEGDDDTDEEGDESDDDFEDDGEGEGEESDDDFDDEGDDDTDDEGEDDGEDGEDWGEDEDDLDGDDDGEGDDDTDDEEGDDFEDDADGDDTDDEGDDDFDDEEEEPAPRRVARKVRRPN